jgi:TonB family protein
MKTHIVSLCSLAAALSLTASNPMSAALQDAKPVVQVAPAYAPDLRAAGVEGDVTVAFTIAENGEVHNAMVVSSSQRLLEYPALAAVRQWKFTPAMKDGVAVSQKAVQTVSFAIAEVHPDTNRLVTLNAHAASRSKDSSSFR